MIRRKIFICESSKTDPKRKENSCQKRKEEKQKWSTDTICRGKTKLPRELEWFFFFICERKRKTTVGCYKSFYISSIVNT